MNWTGPQPYRSSSFEVSLDPVEVEEAELVCLCAFIRFSLSELEFAVAAGPHPCHRSPVSPALPIPVRLTANMANTIPQPDYRLRSVVFVTQRTHAGGAQKEISAERGTQSEPASGEHSEKWTAGKNERVFITVASALPSRPPTVLFAVRRRTDDLLEHRRLDDLFTKRMFFFPIASSVCFRSSTSLAVPYHHIMCPRHL